MKKRVLVLDGNQRSALAVTRSLGRRDVAVIIAECSEKSIAGSSRYSSRSLVYPSPSASPAAFLESIRGMVEKHRIDVVLPMTDITTGLLLNNREATGHASFPFPSAETYDSLANKQRLIRLAESLDLPVPRTYSLERLEDRAHIYAQLRFPIVVKPAYSKVNVGNRWIPIGVQYATSPAELDAIVERSPVVGSVPLLIQERIVGQGHGVFALYDHGRPIAFFSHRRLREQPPSGGVSVFSESMLPNPRSREYAHRLLSHVGWHGVAMVEFKMDTHGVPVLMEVNGRFWGSLQLAIDAGMDFPHLLYRLALGEQIEDQGSYMQGCRSRWLLGDLDRLYWILTKEKGRFSISEKLRATRDFLNFFDSSRHEVNRWGDMKPFIYELGAYFRLRNRLSA